jgi:hypothetical protein
MNTKTKPAKTTKNSRTTADGKDKNLYSPKKAKEVQPDQDDD